MLLLYSERAMVSREVLKSEQAVSMALSVLRRQCRERVPSDWNGENYGRGPSRKGVGPVV